MSKPIKEMMRDELIQRFQDAGSVAICGFTGLDADATYAMRGRLEEKEINFTVVKNSLARAAFKQVGLDTAVDMLDGPCAVAWGADSVVTVVRELLDIAKKSKALTIKGAVLDGDVFSGDAAVKQLSTFPTRDEAIADVVGCILSAGSNVAGCLMGPSGQIASILKTIEEKEE